jgi:hypothetical protein
MSIYIYRPENLSFYVDYEKLQGPPWGHVAPLGFMGFKKVA